MTNPTPAPIYILTADEAAHVLRLPNDDPDMLNLLPQVDAYIKNATGYNWAADTTIRPEAKVAARILIVQWYENPGMYAKYAASLEFGLGAALLQLEAIALQVRKYQFTGRSGAGGCKCTGAVVGDAVEDLVGIIGTTGSAKTDFEAAITIADEIQQTSTEDLSAKGYLVYLKSPTLRDYPA